MSSPLIQSAKEFVDKANTKRVQAFNEPAFGKGSVGTLHGGRSDADGYKFLRIILFGSPKIKVVKGCTLEFKSKSGSIKCNSDTKDIESIYSNSLVKGITEFEIYLDDGLYRSLKTPITSVDITFPKRLFGKVTYSFEIQRDKFARFMK